MKKLTKLLSIVSICTMCIICSLPSTVFCSGVSDQRSALPEWEDPSLNWVQVTTKKNVQQDKIWSITFNEPIDKSTLEKYSIYIRDDNWNIVDTKLSLSQDCKNIKIIPTKNYIPNHPYYLYITNRLKSTSRCPLTKPSCMTFTIKSDALSIDQTNNNQNIQLKKGDKLLLTLPENRDGGYLWNFKPELDNILKIADNTSIIPSPLPGLCGGVGDRCWVIEAIETGKTSINLEETRSWESKMPLSTFKLNITVK